MSQRRREMFRVVENLAVTQSHKSFEFKPLSKAMGKFLLVFHYNCVSILYRF